MHVDLIYAAQVGTSIVAVIKIDAASARRVGFTALHLERDGQACAQPSGAVELARIDRVTGEDASAASARGGTWTGNVDAGSSYLRLRADVQCEGDTMLVVELDTGDTLLRPVVP